MRSPYSYKLPLFVSILLHASVVAMFFVHWPQKPKVQEPVPQHVMAEIIQVESAAEKERKRKVEQQKRQQEEARRRAEQQRKAAEQKKRTEAAAKAAAEKKAKDAEIKAKAAAEKQAAEKKKAEQQKKAEEQKRIAQQQAAEQELFENMLAEQLAAEQREQEEARIQAERAAVLESDFMDQIRAHVSSYWKYPSVVKPDQEVTVKITLVPTGQVVQVVITKNSGNNLLDSSVIAAVNQASPLPVPRDMQVFERSFRNFTMKFRPENASW